MSKTNVHRKPTKAKPLTLADVDIVWSMTATAGVSLVPVLRFGGSQAISTHVQGLCDLLEAHETLDAFELSFVRESLKGLADRLFVAQLGDHYEDDGAAANCKIVPRKPKTGKKAAAEAA